MRTKSASIEEIQAWLLDTYGPPSDEAKAMVEAYKVEREMRLAVGSELLKARKNAGITQAKLAEISGVPQSELSRIEKHGSNPRLATFARLVSALGGRLEITWPEAKGNGGSGN